MAANAEDAHIGALEAFLIRRKIIAKHYPANHPTKPSIAAKDWAKVENLQKQFPV